MNIRTEQNKKHRSRHDLVQIIVPRQTRDALNDYVEYEGLRSKTEAINKLLDESIINSLK